MRHDFLCMIACSSLFTPFFGCDSSKSKASVTLEAPRWRVDKIKGALRTSATEYLISPVDPSSSQSIPIRPSKPNLFVQCGLGSKESYLESPDGFYGSGYVAIRYQFEGGPLTPERAHLDDNSRHLVLPPQLAGGFVQHKKMTIEYEGLNGEFEKLDIDLMGLREAIAKAGCPR
jgi:hypothetical protein